VLVGIAEGDVSGALAARLKVAGGRITEVEAVVARHEQWPPDGETGALFAPRLREAFEPRRFAAEWAAFDRAVRDTSGLGIAVPGTALPAGYETPRERRQLVRDAAAGLTLELTLTDVTGPQRGEASTTGPFTVMAVTLTHRRDAQVVASQGIARPLPFGARSGWAQAVPGVVR